MLAQVRPSINRAIERRQDILLDEHLLDSDFYFCLASGIFFCTLENFDPELFTKLNMSPNTEIYKGLIPFEGMKSIDKMATAMAFTAFSKWNYKVDYNYTEKFHGFLNREFRIVFIIMFCLNEVYTTKIHTNYVEVLLLLLVIDCVRWVSCTSSSNFSTKSGLL